MIKSLPEFITGNRWLLKKKTEKFSLYWNKNSFNNVDELISSFLSKFVIE